MGWPEREIFADQQEVAIKNFRGIDKESFLSKTTKAYMAILGDGRGGIFCENSLEAPSNWGADTQNSIQLGAFDVILTIIRSQYQGIHNVHSEAPILLSA